MRVVLLLLAGFVHAAFAQVDLSMDASEAEQALRIVEARAAGRGIGAVDWQRLFETVPYRRLKAREQSMGRAFTNEEFRLFLLSPEAAGKLLVWRQAPADMKRSDMHEIGTRLLAWLPAGATIHARVFPEIKPLHNSFVWRGEGGEPSIFLYVDGQSTAQFENTVAHECHHIGLNSLEKQQEHMLAGMQGKLSNAIRWLGAFGEGEAMLAAAGSAEKHPHWEDGASVRARWDGDMMHFNANVPALERLFGEVLDGSVPDEVAFMKRAAPFWGDAQGAWYTVGYEMAALVEVKYGRAALMECLLDPRQLLIRYNRIAVEARVSGAQLATWSPEFLKRLTP